MTVLTANSKLSLVCGISRGRQTLFNAMCLPPRSNVSMYFFSSLAFTVHSQKSLISRLAESKTILKLVILRKLGRSRAGINSIVEDPECSSSNIKTAHLSIIPSCEMGWGGKSLGENGGGGGAHQMTSLGWLVCLPPKRFIMRDRPCLYGIYGRCLNAI